MKQKRVIYGVWFFFRDHVYFEIYHMLSKYLMVYYICLKRLWWNQSNFISKQQRFADIEYIITWGEDGNVYKKLLWWVWFEEVRNGG